MTYIKAPCICGCKLYDILIEGTNARICSGVQASMVDHIVGLINLFPLGSELHLAHETTNMHFVPMRSGAMHVVTNTRYIEHVR